MSDNLADVLVILMCVLGPIWLIMHYRYKTRAAERSGGVDAAALDQALRVAQRLEQRLVVLEQILDAEVPTWRGANEAAAYRRQVG